MQQDFVVGRMDRAVADFAGAECAQNKTSGAIMTMVRGAVMVRKTSMGAATVSATRSARCKASALRNQFAQGLRLGW